MGKVIWFTGLSGSGKTTIAEKLADHLRKKGRKVKILDGDTIRGKEHKHLGFSREDIRENNRLIAQAAKAAGKDADFVLVPIISPYQEDRLMAKEIIGDGFVELFINAPLEECIKRDVKGLYKKALEGEIDDFIGVSPKNPYEPPQSPHLEIKSAFSSIEESVQKIFDFLHSDQHKK